MASRWDRIKAVFSSKARERLEEENLRAAEEWDYTRSQRKTENLGAGPDPEVIAERNYVERGAAMMEDDRIARYEQMLDEAAERAKHIKQEPDHGIDR